MISSTVSTRTLSVAASVTATDPPTPALKPLEHPPASVIGKGSFGAGFGGGSGWLGEPLPRAAQPLLTSTAPAVAPDSAVIQPSRGSRGAAPQAGEDGGSMRVVGGDGEMYDNGAARAADVAPSTQEGFRYPFQLTSPVTNRPADSRTPPRSASREDGSILFPSPTTATRGLPRESNLGLFGDDARATSPTEQRGLVSAVGSPLTNSREMMEAMVADVLDS